MIELTDERTDAVGNRATTPPRLTNPRTQETFVLLPVDVYERLTADEYDDSPWTRTELEAVARGTAQRAGRDDPDPDNNGDAEDGT